MGEKLQEELSAALKKTSQVEQDGARAQEKLQEDLKRLQEELDLERRKIAELHVANDAERAEALGKLQCEQAEKAIREQERDEALQQASAAKEERDEALQQASAAKEEILRNQQEKEQLQAELDQMRAKLADFEDSSRADSEGKLKQIPDKDEEIRGLKDEIICLKRGLKDEIIPAFIRLKQLVGEDVDADAIQSTKRETAAKLKGVSRQSKAQGSSSKLQPSPAEREVIKEEDDASQSAPRKSTRKQSKGVSKQSKAKGHANKYEPSRPPSQMQDFAKEKIMILEVQKFREAVAKLGVAVQAAEERSRKLEEVVAACRDAPAGGSAQNAIKFWMKQCVGRIEDSVWLSLSARIEEKVRAATGEGIASIKDKSEKLKK